MSTQKTIEQLASDLGIPSLEAKVLTQLVRFHDLVEEGRQHTNLFGGQGNDFIEILFGDAFAVFAAGWFQDTKRAVDVGTGGGSPGMPLALLCPNVRFDMVEPRRKRVEFVQSAIDAMQLAPRVHVIQGKDTALTSDAYDVAISRATFKPDAWLPKGERLARHVIALGQADTFDEKKNWASRIRYTLPFSGKTRSAVMRLRTLGDLGH